MYGIYKNEQNSMERFLESVKTADEIVLCDTGSTDQTNHVIKKFVENHATINLKIVPIFVSPWRFDDARNIALSLVSPEIDICISLDIDEFFMDDWKEVIISQWEESVTRYHHRFKTFWADGSISEHFHERIHVREGYTWKLPVHELLEYSGVESIKSLHDFFIYHKPEDKETRKSYLHQLEQSVKERKDIWKSWSFLANEYLSVGRYEDALGAIDTALGIENCDKAFLYKQKYVIYKNQNEYELALLSLNTAIFYLPERREMYVEKAKFLSELGRNMEAHSTVLEATKKNLKVMDYHFEPSAWGDTFDRFQYSIYNHAKKEGLEI